MEPPCYSQREIAGATGRRLVEVRRALTRLEVAGLGTDTADSDIDLMIVGKPSTRQIVEALEEASGVLGREVNPGAYSADEFQQKLQSGL